MKFRKVSFWIAAAALTFVSFPTEARARKVHSRPSITIIIDHEAATRSPAGRLRIEDGQRVEIKIVNARTDCFDYGQREQVKSDQDADRSFDMNRRDIVTWHFDHSSLVTSYIVDAKLKTNADQGCRNLPLGPQEWPIPVETLGWSIAFAGAFTADTLTDPVFFLEPGKNPSDSSQAGFLVRSDRKAEDDYKLGTAAMIHLFHTDPERGRINWLGDVKWAPISFGLGINQNSDVRYFLGTSLQFGDQLFLTGGLTLGSRKRLPDTLLRADHFTTDSNALANLPTHTDEGWFIGVSYTFLGSSVKNAFSQRFSSNPPATPSVQSGTQSQGSGAGGAVKLVYEPTPPFKVEEGKSLVLKLKLQGSTSEPVTFKIVAKDGTAKQGTDFTLTAPSEPKIEGTSTVLVTVTTKENTAQQDRDFKLSIENLSSGVTNPGEQTFTILNKGPGPAN